MNNRSVSRPVLSAWSSDAMPPRESRGWRPSGTSISHCLARANCVALRVFSIRWISMKLGVGRRWIKRRCQLAIADGVDVRRAHLYHNMPGAAQEGGVFLPPWSAGDEGHQHIVPAIGAIDKDLVASIRAGAPALREVRHYAENQPLRARDTWRSCRYCMGVSSELAGHFGSSNPENRSLH